ncbi:MAG: hypothetical protein FJ137_21340 [Deltaproteobacteria bacterium]|nr:hypothetical protein [Deltaproteobacteria bacterium]
MRARPVDVDGVVSAAMQPAPPVSSPATFSRRLSAPPRTLDGAQRLAVMTKGSDLHVGAAVMTALLLGFTPTLRRDGIVAQLLPHHDAEAVVDTVEQVRRSGKSRSWSEWEVTAHVVGEPAAVATGSLRSPVAVGDPVHALVPDARPDLALAWQDDRQPSLVGVWFAALLLLIGVFATTAGLVRNRRDLQLLRDGLLTRGTIVKRSSRTVKGDTT